MSLVEDIGRASGGYAIEDDDGAIYVPMVMMNPPLQGKGGAFLDSLPRDRTIKFPGVISPILAGMLERRGFHTVWEWAEGHEDWCEVYVREAS